MVISQSQSLMTGGLARRFVPFFVLQYVLLLFFIAIGPSTAMATVITQGDYIAQLTEKLPQSALLPTNYKALTPATLHLAISRALRKGGAGERGRHPSHPHRFHQHHLFLPYQTAGFHSHRAQIFP
jgi:hypothetical protein